MPFKYCKLFIFYFISIFLFLPGLVLAQDNNIDEGASTEKIFKAEVIQITEERENTLGDGSESFQQNIKLRGLEGEYKDKEFEFIGINDYDVIKKNIYQVGDKVLAVASPDFEGNINYYITDYVRGGVLKWLSLIFVLVLIAVGRWKGLRSIISLIVSFVIILKYIIPGILSGGDPMNTTIIGSILILLAVVYLTEGFNKKSHVASISIFISLVITVLISSFFVNLAKLSGLASEETASIINIGSQMINFKGLLLAGIIIGTLGVLDDVVISQISTVEQMLTIDNSLSRRQVFKNAYEVGVSHISSMTNTLFLAYAGVSMPLLILFTSGDSAFSSWGQIINNEAIATEIVRTLAGSIGLVLSVPISTALSVFSFKK